MTSTIVAMWGARVSVVVGSAIAAVVICVVTGLIPRWGHWYSVNPAYRRQTEALLNGSLALDADPGRVGYDMAWAEGGVQQVWGLGVPAWRLPFEAIAKLAGHDAFPDRIALAIALAVVIYVLVRLLVLSPTGAHSADQPAKTVGALLLILFPPFLTLCQTKFDVYEEAQVYTYLAGIGLFAATLWLVREPGPGRYTLVGGLAGLSPFVRPTLLAYGIASVVIGGLIARQHGLRSLRLWVGPCTFLAGCAVLLLTNAYRFGSPTEFGHSLNLNVYWPMMYATRIDNPVTHAPLLGRIVELFSFLFLVRTDLGCCDGYAPNVLLGQAPVVRWRDVYFSTYDLTFFALISVSWIASFYLVWIGRAKPSDRSITANETVVMGIWSFLASLPLFVFYLYYPVMSSRYMIDFAPAFAVALWAFLQFSIQLLRARFAFALPAILALCVLFATWWAYQVSTAKIFTDTHGGVAAHAPRGPAQMADLSLLNTEAYFPETDFDAYRLPFNGYGWFAKKDWIASIVILFVRAADVVELELIPAENVSLTERDWSRVKVKIGLEWLALKSSTPTANGRRLVFARARPRAQPTVETAFIVLAHRNQILGPSKFRVEAVRW